MNRDDEGVAFPRNLTVLPGHEDAGPRVVAAGGEHQEAASLQGAPRPSLRLDRGLCTD